MRALKDNEYLVYHYSSSKFSEFDKSKCDGIWFTDIEPSNTDMLDEIGAAGSAYVATCIIIIKYEVDEINNYEVFEQFEVENADGAICIYDGFTDYAVADNEQVKILEWNKL